MHLSFVARDTIGKCDFRCVLPDISCCLAQLYRTYRDAMLSLYWEKPERDLTFAEVRQHLDGEVNGLMK